MEDPKKCNICGAYVRKRDGKCGNCEHRNRIKKWREALPDNMKTPCKSCGALIHKDVDDKLCWSCRATIKDIEEERQQIERYKKEKQERGMEILADVKEFLDEGDVEEFTNQLKRFLEDGE